MAQSNARVRASRQRPVSCHFCRSRKLRCSRQFPCSNCTTRGFNCQLYGPQDLPGSSKSRKKDGPDGADSEILARLNRLEDIVMRSTGQPLNGGACLAGTTVAPTSKQPQWQPATNDPQWLERACMDQKSAESICPDPIVFKICPIKKITKFATYFHQSPDSPASAGNITKCIWLPSYDETKILLLKYLSDITYVHHVVHVSLVRNLFDSIYRHLDKQSSPEPSHVALLLSIVASATHSWTARDTSELFSTVGEANSQSASWIKAALDVLEYSRRTTSGALEDIQALIITSFIVSNLEGISSRYRILISTAIMLGRELFLHRIDHPSNVGLPVISPPNSVNAEMGRRVWWYLVATDWMLSRYAGPQEGVYAINPRHMIVNKPRNINDEDLVDGMEDPEVPLSQPTSMSYFLQRIRLAELSREFTDHAPLSDSNLDLMSYNQVMEADAKFDKFIQEMPSFFLLDGGSVDEIAETDARRASGIVIQRYILNSLVHANRCKLHVPYLKRGSFDPTYARSREICLHAARMIIRTERLLEKEDIPFVLTRLKLSGVLYSIAMAIIVLLLDVCFNKGGVGYEIRKEEVLDACSILDEAKEHSTMAARLLGALFSVLPKYQVSLDGRNGPQLPEHESSVTNSLHPITRTEIDLLRAESPDVGLRSGMWESFDCEMNLDNLDWNSFFSELDSQFI